MSRTDQKCQSRAVLYLRVSTPEQADPLNLRNQENACRKLGDQRGLVIAEVFLGPGESGRSADRPSLKQLLHYCKSHRKEIGYVIVESLSRFARNVADQSAAIATLRDNGIALLSVSEPNVDNTAAGRMAAGVHGVFNQYFSDALSEKMKERSAASVRAGRWPRAAPIGFINDLRQENGANIKPDPKTAPLVQEAFELYATGRYTKIQVLKTITDKGLKTKRGHNLSAQTFDAMLRKPIYAGWVYSSTVPKIRGLHQPIITPDTFDAVQRILSGRKLANVPKRKYNPAFPLKHFVKCGSCGTPLTGGMNKGKLKHYGHYWCRNPHCTDRVSISKYVLEADFIEYLKTLKPDAATVAQFPTIASQMWKERHADKAALFKNLNRKLDEQKALKGALLRAKLRGEVSQADYVQANSEFDFEIDEITQHLKTAQLQPANVKQFLRFSKLMLVDVALSWQQASAEQRVRVQNFLFQDGISYKESTKFLNTSKPTLFQQLRDLANCKVLNGVPDGI